MRVTISHPNTDQKYLIEYYATGIRRNAMKNTQGWMTRETTMIKLMPPPFLLGISSTEAMLMPKGEIILNSLEC